MTHRAVRAAPVAGVYSCTIPVQSLYNPCKMYNPCTIPCFVDFSCSCASLPLKSLKSHRGFAHTYQSSSKANQSIYSKLNFLDLFLEHGKDRQNCKIAYYYTSFIAVNCTGHPSILQQLCRNRFLNVVLAAKEYTSPRNSPDDLYL